MFLLCRISNNSLYRVVCTKSTIKWTWRKCHVIRIFSFKKTKCWDCFWALQHLPIKHCGLEYRDICIAIHLWTFFDRPPWKWSSMQKLTWITTESFISFPIQVIELDIYAREMCVYILNMQKTVTNGLGHSYFYVSGYFQQMICFEECTFLNYLHNL